LQFPTPTSGCRYFLNDFLFLQMPLLPHRRLCYLLCSCLCIAAACLALDELEVDVVFKPEECQEKSKKGDLLTMQYVGTLPDGTQFDSSYDHTEPFSFQLGEGHVIPGWDQGMVDMCIGEKRKLRVPPHLGYGETGAGKIPPNSVLLFEVELIKIGDPPPPVNVFKQIDADGDKLLSREEVSDYLAKQVPAELKEGGKQPFDQDQLVEEIFSHEDKDKNGFISQDEFSGPKHDEL